MNRHPRVSSTSASKLRVRPCLVLFGAWRLAQRRTEQMLLLNSLEVCLPWASRCRGLMAEKCILGGALETPHCRQGSSVPRSQHSAVQLTNSLSHLLNFSPPPREQGGAAALLARYRATSWASDVTSSISQHMGSSQDPSPCLLTPVHEL